MYLDVLNDVENFPFDSQTMDIKIEFSSKMIEALKEFPQLGDVAIKPIIYKIKLDSQESNKYNFFSIRNNIEYGTKQTEALDALNIYNNSSG